MSEQEKQTVPERLDAIFQSFARSDAPGMVVGVAHRGKTIYRKGFGLASIEHAVANTPEMRYRIGSTSKHFACLAALLLAEDGLLDLDTPIRNYLPELPEAGGNPTLRQLMSHTGGMRCHIDLGFISDSLAGIKPEGECLKVMGRQSGINFPSGERMMYCNSGYHLFSRVIEKVTQAPFEAFLDARIFHPLGMGHSRSVRSDFEILPNMATLHVPLPGGGYRRGIFQSEELLGEGAIISTVDDMLIWQAHLRGDKKIGSAQTWAQLTTPAVTNGGEELEYCLGLLKTDYRGAEVWHHAGGVVGGSSQMATVPAHELDIIIITNGAVANPTDLAFRVMDAVLGDDVLAPPVAHLEAATVAHRLGTYRAASSGLVFDLADVDGKLGMRFFGGPGLPLRKGDGHLYLPFSGCGMGPFRLDLASLEQGAERDDLTLFDCGNGDVCPKVAGPASDEGVFAAALDGRFFAPDLDAHATFGMQGGRLSLSIRGWHGGNTLRLTPLADDLLLFTAEPEVFQYRGALTLLRDGDQITGFELNTARTRHLTFTRDA